MGLWIFIGKFTLFTRPYVYKTTIIYHHTYKHTGKYKWYLLGRIHSSDSLLFFFVSSIASSFEFGWWLKRLITGNLRLDIQNTFTYRTDCLHLCIYTNTKTHINVYSHIRPHFKKIFPYGHAMNVFYVPHLFTFIYLSLDRWIIYYGKTWFFFSLLSILFFGQD